jgi:hypothetical protein
MNFYNYFSVFKHLWTGPHFSESSGALAQDSTDSVNSAPRTAGSIYVKNEGSYAKPQSRRGIA